MLTKSDSQSTSPFDVFTAACGLIDRQEMLPADIKNHLKDACAATLPPTSLAAISLAIKCLQASSIDPHELGNLQESMKCLEPLDQRRVVKVAQSHPVFHALCALYQARASFQVRRCYLRLYISIFHINQCSYDGLDADIYYHDAYYCRDILIDHLNSSDFKDEVFSSDAEFKIALVSALSNIVKVCSRGNLLRTKAARFSELITGERRPGQRQRANVTHTVDKAHDLEEIENDHGEPFDGSSTEIAHPNEEGSDDYSDADKTIRRKAPVGGSQLGASDDRYTLFWRMHAQAAKNNPCITDMHRLAMPTVAGYFSYLIQTNLNILAFNWILIGTGIQPNRLMDTKLENVARPDGFFGCHINLKTGEFSYEVFHRDNQVELDIARINLPMKISRLFEIYRLNYPFKGQRDIFSEIAAKYSLNHPGPTPTPRRVAASACIHFTKGHLNEVESAFLSGCVPGLSKAKAHYESVDITELNKKFQQANKSFIDSLLESAFCSSLGEYHFPEFRDINQALPCGNLGSKDAYPITVFSDVFTALHFRADQIIARSKVEALHDVHLQNMIDFIQLQHMQLFVLEQLSFCARKFGEKTKYSISPNNKRACGSEKASSTYSVERKFIPINEVLLLQIEACRKDIESLSKLCARYKYSFDVTFDGRTSPLPLHFSINHIKGNISAIRMNSALFDSEIKDRQIFQMPKASNPRVNVFKHVVANALKNKVPRSLLDEFMTHDRDGLDICGKWSTASLLCLDLLEKELNSLFEGLNIVVLMWGSR